MWHFVRLSFVVNSFVYLIMRRDNFLLSNFEQIDITHCFFSRNCFITDRFNLFSLEIGSCLFSLSKYTSCYGSMILYWLFIWKISSFNLVGIAVFFLVRVYVNPKVKIWLFVIEPFTYYVNWFFPFFETPPPNLSPTFPLLPARNFFQKIK